MLALMSGRSRRALALGSMGTVFFGIVVACVGDDPKLTLGSTDGGADGTTVSSSSGNSSGSNPGTDAGGDTGPTGATCAGDTTLKHADGTTEECRFGCVTSPDAHCGTIYPTGSAIKPDMLSLAGVLETTFTAAGPTKFDTDTGLIEGTRDANDDPLTMQVKDGIGFKVADIDATHRIAIWVFDSLTIAANAAIRFTSTNAVGFVVAKTATINGTIDLRGYNDANQLCKPTNFGAAVLGGPAGGAGSLNRLKGNGPGGGYPSDKPGSFYVPGTGGGGFGGAGGRGGLKDGGAGDPSASGVGGDGGVIYGEPTLNPLLGGSGGAGVSSYSGGGGGGAIHLVVGGKLMIGDGLANGGINAGGCPGVDPSMGSPGGGGGSGGAVLVETPVIEIKQNAGIAANGGTGGSGSAGKIENSVTQAFAGGGGYGSPGSGGGALSPTGQDGYAMPASGYSGGAGGGGAGRIRINTRTGNFSAPGTAILSPALSAPGSPTTVGKLDVH